MDIGEFTHPIDIQDLYIFDIINDKELKNQKREILKVELSRLNQDFDRLSIKTKLSKGSLMTQNSYQKKSKVVNSISAEKIGDNLFNNIILCGQKRTNPVRKRAVKRNIENEQKTAEIPAKRTQNVENKNKIKINKNLSSLSAAEKLNERLKGGKDTAKSNLTKTTVNETKKNDKKFIKPNVSDFHRNRMRAVKVAEPATKLLKPTRKFEEIKSKTNLNLYDYSIGKY